jgi:hypothetical protein
LTLRAEIMEELIQNNLASNCFNNPGTEILCPRFLQHRGAIVITTIFWPLPRTVVDGLYSIYNLQYYTSRVTMSSMTFVVRSA